MTCIRIPNGIITIHDSFRLRLEDGTCVFMYWHPFCGPTIYRDREERREVGDWYDNALICKAIDWFISRGGKA